MFNIVNDTYFRPPSNIQWPHLRQQGRRSLCFLSSADMRRASVARNDSPILQRLSGIVLALVVFAIDTFTHIESAIAVLYVLVMLIVSGTLGQRGICKVSAGCAFLTIVSHLISHGFVADLPTVLRLGRLSCRDLHGRRSARPQRCAT